MKKFILIALLTVALAAPAFASNPAEMTARKNAATKELNVRIAAAQKKLACLQNQQTCVSSATDSTSLNKCHPEGCKD